MSVTAIGNQTQAWQVGTTPPPRPDMTKTMAPVAQALGLSTDDLQTQLKSGKSLSDLAQAKGVSRDDLLKAVEQGIQNGAPQGAPALSTDQLTQMANHIADNTHTGGHHHHGGHGGGHGGGGTPTDQAQSNLQALSGQLGVDPSDLLQQLTSGQGSEALSSNAWSSDLTKVDGGLLVDQYA